MEQLLVCDHITKRVGNFILRDIHFELEPGYITAIIGSNGAGKSTLIRSLLGSYKLYNHVEDYTDNTIPARGLAPNRGDVYIDGYSIKKNPKEYKDRIAFIMNDCPFSMRLSAKDNGRLYGSYYSDFDYNQYEQFCKKYNVPFKIALKKLSKGEQIKMQLAFALSRKAKVYILDEPAGNLDVKFRDEFYEIMRGLVENGERSILYVTHLVDELDVLADYVLWIENGEQVGYGTLEGLLDQYRLYNGNALSADVQQEKGFQIVAVKENDIHKEILLHSIQGTFPEEIEKNARRATLKEIMYYEKETKGVNRECR